MPDFQSSWIGSFHWSICTLRYLVWLLPIGIRSILCYWNEPCIADFMSDKKSCHWSHFSPPHLCCREWNQHVVSIRQYRCIGNIHYASQNIANISHKPNRLYAPPSPPASEQNIAFCYHDYWQKQHIWLYYLFSSWCQQQRLKNKWHRLIS